MKAMPLPFDEFQGKGVLDLPSSYSESFHQTPCVQNHHLHQQQQQKWLNNNNNSKENCCYVGSEPTSVLDTRRSPSPPTSSSTLSSSQGGGGGGSSTDTTTTTNGLAADGSGNIGVSSTEKCGQQLGMEDWESVLSGSPSQEQSILRLIMGDVEDPSLGLNKLLQTGGGSTQDLEFNAGFGYVDQVLAFDPTNNSSNFVNNIDPSSDFPLLNHNPRQTHNQNPNPNPIFSAPVSNLLPGMFHQAADEKPLILSPQVIINQNQAQFSQNPAVFLPLSYTQLQEHHLLSPPPPKRLNSGAMGGNNYPVPKVSLSDARPELFMLQQQQQLQMLQRPAAMAAKQKMGNDELANQQFQQAIINPICQAAELIDSRNPVLAQGILARLNHQLSLPIGKPYHRAAFYFKEALQLAIHSNTNTTTSSSACSLIFKIGAYKCLSEFSPVLQFANFTRNQALLEAFEGFDRIHIVDFDIGFGGQWSSLMQELALRNGGAPELKITAFASSDDIELGFTQENLRIFAGEINIPFQLEILSLEALNSGSWPMPLHVSDKQVIGVNLPVGAFSSYPAFLPLVIRFVKQLSPKIVVSLDRGCDRTDLPFAHHVNHAIQSYSTLLESLDAVNMNLDALQKIERLLVQPCIEKLVLGRHRCPDKVPPCRSLFLQSGFTSLPFSNFAESQAECLVQRIPVRGFHVEKRQSALVLCWQRKELISASAWRC